MFTKSTKIFVITKPVNRFGYAYF